MMPPGSGAGVNDIDVSVLGDRVYDLRDYQRIQDLERTGIEVPRKTELKFVLNSNPSTPYHWYNDYEEADDKFSISDDYISHADWQ